MWFPHNLLLSEVEKLCVCSMWSQPNLAGVDGKVPVDFPGHEFFCGFCCFHCICYQNCLEVDSASLFILRKTFLHLQHQIRTFKRFIKMFCISLKFWLKNEQCGVESQSKPRKFLQAWKIRWLLPATETGAVVLRSGSQRRSSCADASLGTAALLPPASWPRGRVLCRCQQKTGWITAVSQ